MAAHTHVVIQGDGGTWTLTTDNNDLAWVDLAGDTGTLRVWLTNCPQQVETLAVPANGSTITVTCTMK